ncbi:MAG: hypothetical protein AAFP90_07565 [Planctomycetota bacterium]
MHRLPSSLFSSDASDSFGTEVLDHESGRCIDGCEFFLPSRYTSGYAYPLLIWLHDDGGNERQVSQLMPHISTQNFVAVGVRGNAPTDDSGQTFDWDTEDGAQGLQTQRSIRSAVSEARRRYNVHPERIFIGGHGSGGTMAMRMAFQGFPGAPGTQFAGVVSLGGKCDAVPPAELVSALYPPRKLPMMWALATRSESYCPMEMEHSLRRIAAASVRADIRQYVCDDELMSHVLADVNRWIMQVVTSENSPADTQRQFPFSLN